ncbi:4Fe-4S binding protein [Dethiobacter alkaliphilus]|uniref:4Fe-4S ferredoxin iron-sulfur binding domain protein n=1 Tax=Dethiobacter alkaliphilus AHT 1 TaxID=555088 RepID=C0GDX6_DETAL|nr:4Fe-4S binding protein [Dethiobacter alkaliphilus]EEG78270.1 4Fe-4S ferredoxin iron-sulfur binding domain protein [Dethiobacter alkaliphilus AHT 1]MCW3491472.1 4Fe-4S binding protein [Dethiobacter alkaliphilus]
MKTYAINQQLCDRSPGCKVKKECPSNAIVQMDGDYYIDMLACRRCGLCVKTCPHGAVGESAS